MQTSFMDLVGTSPAHGFLAVGCDELTDLAPALDTALLLMTWGHKPAVFDQLPRPSAGPLADLDHQPVRLV